MIRVSTKHHGIVEIDFGLDAVPFVRPFQRSAPHVRVIGTREGFLYLVPLGEMDFSRDSLFKLNS